MYMYMVGAIHYWTLFVGVLILYIQKCYIFYKSTCLLFIKTINFYFPVCLSLI